MLAEPARRVQRVNPSRARIFSLGAAAIAGQSPFEGSAQPLLVLPAVDYLNKTNVLLRKRDSIRRLVQVY